MRTKVIFIALQLITFCGYPQSFWDRLESAGREIAWNELDLKTSGALSNLIGTWIKYEAIYPDGSTQLFTGDEQITLRITKNLNLTEAFHDYAVFKNGENIDQGIITFEEGGTLCFNKSQHHDKVCSLCRFETDERGFKVLLLKVSANWIKYQRRGD